MKKLVPIATVLPTLSFAHGVHLPVPEPSHAAAHNGINVGLAIAAVVVTIWLVRRYRA